MKTIFMALVILLAGTTTFAQTHKSKKHHRHHHMTSQMYTCSMHPEVVQNKPGTCPKCGMALVKTKGKKAGTKKEMDGMKM